MIADDTVPHQIRLTAGNTGLAVSCNCRHTPAPNGGPPSYPPLTLLPFGAPAETILAGYREHLDDAAEQAVNASTTATGEVRE